MCVQGILMSVDSVLLAKDEKVVNSWQGTREIVEQTVAEDSGKKNFRVKERKNGTLVLTNQRLLFVEKEKSKENSQCKEVNVPLIDVSNLFMEQPPLEWVDSAPKIVSHVFRLKKVRDKKKFEEFKKQVDEHCQRRRVQVAEQTKEKVHMKLS